MEAMGCGLPVVASRLSGIPELVEDGVEGFLVEPGDVDGLASALVRVAGDAHLRQRMGAAGRSRIERDHDVAINATRLVHLMEGAAS
jgi:glycosyltransferase involved in cell wall biosynthesis